MVTKIKSFDEYGHVNGVFAFDPQAWRAIGEDGTGRVGHYTQQGDRTLYASPRVSKLAGRRRFVLAGTGYWPVTEGYSWGYGERELSLDEALQIMAPQYVAEYAESEALA